MATDAYLHPADAHGTITNLAAAAGAVLWAGYNPLQEGYGAGCFSCHCEIRSGTDSGADWRGGNGGTGMSTGQTQFKNCIKCTVCTTYCPVAKVNPDYPARKQAGPDGERLLRRKTPCCMMMRSPLCTNCKRCEVWRPSENVRIGDIIARAKLTYSPSRPKIRDAILSHTDLMGSLSSPFAPVVNTITGLKPVRKLLDTV